MKKLEIEMYFDGDKKLHVVNEAFVLERCRAMFPEGYIDATLTLPFSWKSNAAMGRFFGAVAALLHQFLSDSGYTFPDKLAAVYYVMENLPAESGLGLSDKWVDFVHDPSGRVVSRKARPISGMGKAELHELDSDLSKFLADMGIDVLSSEDFKKK